ncbi:RecQ family ATP-dependent DNA helicase [Heyndrickxia sp. NPDC080065]|uniref:RecQ family ATP-dependent DNA helicase n=1 Tax=Heyndrickxia sp. NPDC080065 TaxID=3390568 RepID=UPI003CFC2148
MKLYETLKKHFGYHSFRKGQEEVITSILAGQDTLAVLPTGTGKSLCYQIPGYMLPGTVVIVSPLLSLMQDQVEQLRINGEKKVVALNSFLSIQERKKILQSLQYYRFIYISPEMLTNQVVIQKLKKIVVSLFVIDEAHCISQWGHDFRPDYLCLKEVRLHLGNPVTLALTATATDDVRNDIIHYLNLNKVNELIFSVDRPNIALVVEETANYQEKTNKLLQLVKGLQKPGIIYFSSKRVSEEIATLLRKHGIAKAESYHGGMDQEQRILIQQQFLHDQLQVICATSAFGMGVNKENIRFVIHFHMPYQIESYLQEIGRAGRDGEKSIAILLYSSGDELLPLQIFENELPTEFQIEQFYAINNEHNSEREIAFLNLTDIQLRFLNFYSELFKGETEVVQKVKKICEERVKYKRLKLQEMKKWIQSTNCRRRGILQYFNEKPISQNYNCCDKCGIQMNDYNMKDLDVFIEEKENWLSMLNKLLLRGDKA